VCTPTQCGVPYSRPRYFCLAKALPLPFAQPYAHDAIVPHPPQPSSAFPGRPAAAADGLGDAGEAEAAQRAGGAECGRCVKLEWNEGACQPISDYLEDPGSSGADLWQVRLATAALGETIQTETHMEDGCTDAIVGAVQTYGVPDAVIARWRRALDAVTPASTRACCFTKSYYQYLKGTGSLLAHTQEHVAWLKRNEEADEQEASDAGSDAKRKAAAAGGTGVVSVPRFRYFTPREVANIHGKPKHFSFPQEVTLKQRCDTRPACSAPEPHAACPVHC
jgi:tRNA (cytosine38-C5)-methyltransferase